MAAMSDLPEIITVKRKRDKDGGALDYLCFEDYANKRHKGPGRNAKVDSVDWIYQCRKEVDLESAEKVPSQPRQDLARPEGSGPPAIQVSEAGDENRPIKPLRQKKATENGSDRLPAPAVPVPAFLGEDIRSARRFHLARSQLILLDTGVIGSRVSKKRSAVFVERTETARPGQKAHSHGQLGQLDSRLRETKDMDLAGGQSDGDLDHVSSKSEAATVDMQIDGVSPPASPPCDPATDPARARKRPGARARIPSSQQKLPPSLLDRQNVGLEQLTREMDAFALEQASRNLAQIEEEKKKEQARAARAATRTKFRPKSQAPGQRIFERDPALVARLEQERTGISATGIGDADVDMDGEDEDDYVLETYVRVPASRLTEAVQPHQVGFLVFDTEPDRLEFFYGDEEDSEDEVLEDADDENAENHYSTEYPDEDLAWDDETGQNAYSYLTQNASDLEEFDEDAFMEQAWDKDVERSVEDKILQRSIV